MGYRFSLQGELGDEKLVGLFIQYRTGELLLAVHVLVHSSMAHTARSSSTVRGTLAFHSARTSAFPGGPPIAF
jgi:hypothetical protein